MNAYWERTLYQVDVDCAQLYYDNNYGSGRASGIRALSSSLIDGGFPGTYWAGAYGVSAGGGWGTPTKFVDTRISQAGLYAKKYSTATWRFLGVGDDYLPQAPVRAHRALATGSGGLRVYSSPSGATNTWTYVGSYSYTANGGTSVGDNVTGNYTVFSN